MNLYYYIVISVIPVIKNKKKEWNVKNQISLIIEVQKILKGKKSYIIPRIESSIGHEIESFIVQTKKISKMICPLKKCVPI